MFWLLTKFSFRCSIGESQSLSHFDCVNDCNHITCSNQDEYLAQVTVDRKVMDHREKSAYYRTKLQEIVSCYSSSVHVRASCNVHMIRRHYSAKCAVYPTVRFSLEVNFYYEYMT